MAFGGTAKTYATWTLVGEPFEENKREYIFVVKPGTTVQKKVRWYSDKAHADLMPGASKKEEIPLYTLFGFENEEDYILCIRQIDLTEQEERDYFWSNWKKGKKWRGNAFYGGVWYAPKGAEIPPVRNKDKVFRAYWSDFKEQGRKYCKELAATTSLWS